MESDVEKTVTKYLSLSKLFFCIQCHLPDGTTHWEEFIWTPVVKKSSLLKHWNYANEYHIGSNHVSEMWCKSMIILMLHVRQAV